MARTTPPLCSSDSWPAWRSWSIPCPGSTRPGTDFVCLTAPAPQWPPHDRFTPLTSVQCRLCMIGGGDWLLEKSSVAETWCVVLASRQSLQRRIMTSRVHLLSAMRRAARMTPRETTAAVIATSPEDRGESSLDTLDIGNLFVQPRYQGTAYEVLFSLLNLE